MKLLNKITNIKSKILINRGIISKSKIKKFIPDAPIILEAGAHIGIDTIEMATLWPNSTLYAFEPVPNVYKQLKNNTKNYKNILTYPVALSDKTGERILYISSGESDGSSSLLSPNEHLIEHPNVIFSEQIKTSVITINDWVIHNGIKRIDFLWLDMQGHELSVLKNATKILNTVSAIYTEVSLKEMYHGCDLYPTLCQWLEEHDFHVEIEALPWPDMGNVLFTKRTFA
jgi:FkbM family methyltransferase